MHNINTLIRKIATTQLADLSSDKATIRLLVPTQKLMLITSEEHKQIQYGDIILLPENLAFKLKAQRLKSEKKVAKTACYLFEITPAFFQDKSWSHFFVKKSLTFIRATTPTVKKTSQIKKLQIISIFQRISLSNYIKRILQIQFIKHLSLDA